MTPRTLLNFCAEARGLKGAARKQRVEEVMERVERPLIESVLLRTEGNQIRAAALLGINRNTLRKKIALLGIPLPDRS